MAKHRSIAGWVPHGFGVMVAVGTQLGPYRVTAALGAGGMGEVYRATDVRLGREVAVKVLPARLAHDEAARVRFEREARAVAALAHPNILVLYDIGTEQGTSFAVTELLEGETLRRRLAGGSLQWPRAVELGVLLADGLGAAHARGIVHRDLKPENIFLTTDGRLKVLDFGLARVDAPPDPGADTGLYTPAATDPGTVMGTVGYMSPEQVRGEAADARSDLFSLGCVLYEMVSGRRPFARPTAADTMAAILRDAPPPLSAVEPPLPPELPRIIGRCLEKNPDERFQSARDLGFALRAIQADSGSGPRAAGVPARSPRRAAALAAVAVLILVGVAVALYLRRDAGGPSGPPGDDSRVVAVAVLPFENVGGDQDAEYFSDGLAEHITHQLSRLRHGELTVRPFTSAARFRGKADLGEVARALDVQALVTGRVTHRGDRLVVSVALVDVRQNRQLWGDQFERGRGEVVAVQNQIVRELAANLGPRLTAEEEGRLRKPHTEDPDAYHRYLRGRYYWNKRTPDWVRKAIEQFQQAVEADPAYAAAYAGIADCYETLSVLEAAPPVETRPKGKAAALRALEIDPTLAEPHATLAWAACGYDWDWAGAEACFKRSIEADPRYAVAHHWYSIFLAAAGRFEEARVAARRAQELDPLSLIIATGVGIVLFFERRYDDAVAQFRKVLETEPTFLPARNYLGLALESQGRYEESLAELEGQRTETGLRTSGLLRAYARSGRRADARQALAELLGRKRYVSAYTVATVHEGLGDRDQAIAWLERAAQERSNWLIFLGVDPRLDGVRTDPRFADLRRRVGPP